jgi:pimeloyl-ACP methyl ester carboxylesterase
MVEVWGRRVHVHGVGEGAPVLLLHGNGSLGEEILSWLPPTPGHRWIAPDRPGYGWSDPLPKGCQDPLTQAAWADALLEALGIGRAHVVAHSIGSAAALCLAAIRPERVAGLVLMAPFCRPTPHRWKLGLRLSVAPVVGGLIRRRLAPLLVRRWGRRMLSDMLAPTRLPPWLEGFPMEHAARPDSIVTLVDELRAFNATMEQVALRLRVEAPVLAILGELDRTAPAEWHLPWIQAHAERVEAIRLRGVGHCVHHAEPERVRAALLAAVAGRPAGEAAAEPEPGRRAARPRGPALAASLQGAG